MQSVDGTPYSDLDRILICTTHETLTKILNVYAEGGGRSGEREASWSGGGWTGEEGDREGNREGDR